MARTTLGTAVSPSRVRRGPVGKSRLDAATLLGFASGLGLVALAMTMGGSFASFLDVPSLLIVFGGTFGVVTVCFSLTEMGRAHSVAYRAIVRDDRDPTAAAMAALELADTARRKGILALEQKIDSGSVDAFCRQALGMVLEGAPGEEIENVLKREIHQTMQRHASSAGIFRKAAEVSPGMGLIGTLIGLVQMLSNLNDPASIGPSMAVAVLTTFYGAVLATMVFAPLAAKLERNAENDVLVANVYLLAAASIARQENPRRLEGLLNALLPPDNRIHYFK
jgi:chemotaxis protein MotA